MDNDIEVPVIFTKFQGLVSHIIT